MTTIANTIEETPTLPLVSQLRMMASALLTADHEGIPQCQTDWIEYQRRDKQKEPVLTCCALVAIVLVLYRQSLNDKTKEWIVGDGTFTFAGVFRLLRAKGIEYSTPLDGHEDLYRVVTFLSDVLHYSFAQIADHLTQLADRIEQSQP